MKTIQLKHGILNKIAAAQYIMLRYETEFTPCTGITAVTKQERRHFAHGIMVAPWCPKLKRKNPEDDPLESGKVCPTNWEFNIAGRNCKVLATTDEFLPILFLKIEGHFQGIETPYDTPTLTALKRESLYFGLAVDALMQQAEAPREQFVWGADWETVPALSLVRDRHITALTLHNTFDESLENEALAFGSTYAAFCGSEGPHGEPLPVKTALQVGLKIADVATTVNRGFAYGMKTEPLQKEGMARHLQGYVDRVVGINNAAFATLSTEHIELSALLASDFDKGHQLLLESKREKVERLPEAIRKKAEGKAIVVSMGRRVSQKQHDVLVECLRDLLQGDPTFPVLAFFTTIHGDAKSPAILARIRALEAEFPANVVCHDGLLPYYGELMAAADFNCMPSLYEPHGGAFEGTVVPIARAVDGLAEQICGLNPRGSAKELNDVWHEPQEEPSGLLFREELPSENLSLARQFDSLLQGSPFSELFQAMRDALTPVLREAVTLRVNHPRAYSRLVSAALKKQQSLSWQHNFDGMIALIEQARKRKLR